MEKKKKKLESLKGKKFSMKAVKGGLISLQNFEDTFCTVTTDTQCGCPTSDSVKCDNTI